MPRSSELPSAPKPRSWIVIVCFVALLCGIVWLKKRSGDDAREPAPASTKPAAPSPTPAPKIVNVAPPSLLEPEDKVFAHYAGSESCRGCHADQFGAWEKSNHGLAERPPSQALDGATFEPARTFKHGTQTSTASAKDGKFFVETLGFDTKQETYAVARVIGHDPLRQYLVERPGGRIQTLEASFDPHGGAWFNVYGDEDRKPGEWGHWTGRGMNWNTMCASCHNTRLRKNYDPPSDTYRTTMAEMSVGCESCHGPMKAHAAWRKEYPQSKEADPTVKKMDRDQVFDTCGSCHARRRELSGDFVPGDAFHQHYQLTTVDGSDLYFADGKVRDELYEYGSFLSSKMHAAGVRCVDCHDPHRAEPKLPGNALCMTCHAGGIPAPSGTVPAPVIDPVKHSFHAADSTGAQCVGCHMPQTIYMQKHSRHDHGFSIPDPLLTKEHAIPNACNQCHTDKDTDWAITAADTWWGEKMKRPARERARRIADARAGGPAAGAPLLTLLRDEPSPYWKAAILRVLAPWIGEPDTARAFLEYAQHADPLVRTAAAQGLDALGGENTAAQQVLARKLEDPSRSVRTAAAWGLRATLDAASRAGRELSDTLAHGADQPTGQMQLGVWALSRGDVGTGLTHFARAVEWDPYSGGIRHEYAVALSMAGRADETLVQMQEAARLEPKNAEFRYKLALARNETGDLAAAVAEFESTVKLDPQHARAWYNLGLARNTQGDPAGAVAALKSGESADPRDPRIPYARATIHARLGQRADAKAACEAALIIAPQMQEARQMLEALR